jgi:hypothetical protein
MNNLSVTVVPAQQMFEVKVGKLTLESRNYYSSSNAYRGARAAIRNLAKRNVWNESTLGNSVVALVNDNNYPLAFKSYAKSNAATKATGVIDAELVSAGKSLRKLELSVESN